MRVELKTTMYGINEKRHAIIVGINSDDADYLEGNYVKQKAILSQDGEDFPVEILDTLSLPAVKDGIACHNAMFMCKYDDRAPAINKLPPTLNIDVSEKRNGSDCFKIQWSV